MVLDKLSDSLKNTLKKIARAVFIDESLINELIKDIQRALLQSDVNVQLVFDLTKEIKKRALEEKPPKSISQKEYLIKIVYEELVRFLGKEQKGIKIEKKKPFKIMMIGLFGSGKCVHPESMIPLSNGEILLAEDLYKKYNHLEKEFLEDAEVVNIENEDLYVPSFNPQTLKIENKKVTHLWKLKGKDLLKIDLDNGNDFSVKVTPEHPFFVLRQGRLKQIRADSLNEDDFVAVPRTYTTKPSFVSLFDSLKGLNLSVLLEPNKAKKIILSKYSTILEVHKNLKFKRNYCKLTTEIKKGVIPIEFLNSLDNNKIKFKNSNRFINFPEYLTTDLAEFLGYVIGDGHLDKKYIQITSEDSEVLSRVSQLSITLFSIKPTIRKDKRTKGVYRLNISSTTLVEILNKLFGIPIGKKGKKLRVPTQIMKSDDLCLKAFLRAYFDCESYPDLNSRGIEISSESSFLIKNINLLLLRLGIVSTISKKIINEIPYWRLYIRARYAEVYSEKIGFLIKIKQSKSINYKNIGIKQGCGKQDLIPISNLLKDVRTSLGFSIGEIQNVCSSYGRYEGFGIISRESLFKVKELYLTNKTGIHHGFLNNIKNKINLKSSYSGPVINSLISFYKKENIINQELNLTEKGQILLQKQTNSDLLVNYLSLLSESDVCWIGIKKIEKEKAPEFVYDLTIEDNHSFVADGIIVHNTTSIAKLANYYQKRGYKIATLGLDIHRPAAIDQLKQLSDQVKVQCFYDRTEKDPVKIYKKFEKEYSKYDILIIDTAGRDALSKDLIKEIETLNKTINPEERLLVISADIGQAAKKQAEQFHESCNITGIIVTKMDGTARAGGALSSCSVTKAPIKFIGTGEKINDIEEFDPEGFVSRLLGMGDLKALLEKAKEAISEEQAQDLGKKFLKGEFNFIDLYEQMQAMKKMGPLNKIVELIPGMGNLNIPKDMINVQEDKLKKWRYILDSMNKEELENPDLVFNRTRIDRIAKGSGTTSKEVRELLKQYRQSKKLMKAMKGIDKEGDFNKVLRKFKGKMPKGFGM